MTLTINPGSLDCWSRIEAPLADRGDLIALGGCNSWRGRTGRMIRGCCASSRSFYRWPEVKDYITKKSGRFIVPASLATDAWDGFTGPLRVETSSPWCRAWWESGARRRKRQRSVAAPTDRMRYPADQIAAMLLASAKVNCRTSTAAQVASLTSPEEGENSRFPDEIEWRCHYSLALLGRIGYFGLTARHRWLKDDR
ncbi:hypothetical protein [Bradyrhizobium sp. Ai1a-2]|uniref:hypothetical protein n=1 Tax=Bradyrhizobium sp. Ai1a-2 TaxID=196490 RepID=UPI001362891F|nr:hypothetical protein [Bradyrhizobium sp. Ai1a-2]